MKKKTKSKKQPRASKSFYNAAFGAKPGQNIAGRIERARGRNNAKITKNTVDNWKKAGLVEIPTGAKIVRLTNKGHALVTHAAKWRQ